ncbi:malate/lactate/ureidoglycolate dehydrogenase [Sedimentitalea todarodis]|uniref:Malate/lactate/ureidoglycolate dehydrogenase n=1 Tax=Sedimentitalea todarodis TaxID=1631240 RepID=A0ABU3VLT3_9RHOB|nr:malate/lactate/ureidoglycolate dehydrogenase [Sedimentitalea todarodis]MDU9007089.1 malate/lactate/ureidoglycolate dehydrogenase [Sedimentitalea todarodis]
MRISSQDLTLVATDILTKACGNQEAATKVADRLVFANLTGHDSHGVGVLPGYVGAILAGELHAKASASVVQDDGVLLQIDGQQGFGQIVSEQAMNLAIERARVHKLTVLALRNSFHIGRVGDWATMAAEAGFISVHFVNVLSPNSLVAPFGGRSARFTTNPFCAAIPKSPDHPMILLDMATSAIAQGKVRVAHLAGAEVPENCLVDAQGVPTRDPSVMFEEPKGALTTMGLHKGFGLSLLCDILGGALSGGGAYLPSRVVENRVVNNMFAILIDPDVFGGAEAFFSDIDQYTDWVKSSPPAPGSDGVFFPGDPERLAYQERSEIGIPLDAGTLAALEGVAKSLGLQSVFSENGTSN